MRIQVGKKIRKAKYDDMYNMKNENRRRSACITFNNFSFSYKSPGSDLSIIMPHAMSYMH